MAYRLMKQLVELGRKTKDELLAMADVYYAAGRLTDGQYTELVEQISVTE